MRPVRTKQTVSMQTRDGVRLDADVYYPEVEDDVPVLLMRQPYGRAIASTVVYAHPIWYAAHEYIVVIQDVRGRGTSEGDFSLFAHEVEDGADTIEWAASLPGSNGSVGMYGFSYQGMTQLYAAAEQPSALKTLCPAMIGYDLYADWAYEGGGFCLHASLSWAMQLAAETARRQGRTEAYQALYSAARLPPSCDPVSAHSALLQELAPDSFYHDWLAHPEPDDYWDALSPRHRIQAVDLPMLHIGGWYDTYMRGTLRFYREMAARSQHPQHLWVGPWGHLPWGRRVGAQDFGPEAHRSMDELHIRWFDQMLKGKDTGMLDEPPVWLFELGSNQWRSHVGWPERPSQTYFLASAGLASVDSASGRLSATPSKQNGAVPDVLVHDPWRPVPSVGGHATAPSGPFERSAIDDRTDVLTYTSAPLIEDLHLAGEFTVELYVAADAPSFDLCTVLSEVYPDGRVFNLTQGYRRIHEGSGTSTPPLAKQQSGTSLPGYGLNMPPKPVAIAFQPVCACIPQHHALRLSLSAASFPSYSVNSGTRNTAKGDRLIDARVITIVVYADPSFPSKLELSCLV